MREHSLQRQDRLMTILNVRPHAIDPRSHTDQEKNARHDV
jgi:hypothetical protein